MIPHQRNEERIAKNSETNIISIAIHWMLFSYLNCYLEIFKGGQVFFGYVVVSNLIIFDTFYYWMYHIYVSVYCLEWTSGTEPDMRDAYYIAYSCKKIECTKIQW